MRITQRVMKALSRYNPDEDGPCIELFLLDKELPGRRWDLYLIGETSSSINRGSKATIKPLMGRTIERGNVVVLIASLHDWLTHYNPSDPEVVEIIIRNLLKAQMRHTEHLREIKIENCIKRAAQQKKQKQKPTSSKPMKVTSHDVFGVWK